MRGEVRNGVPPLIDVEKGQGLHRWTPTRSCGGEEILLIPITGGGVQYGAQNHKMTYRVNEYAV